MIYYWFWDGQRDGDGFKGRCRSSGASEEIHFCNFSSSIDFLIVRLETYKSSRALLWLPMLTSAEGLIFKVMLSTGFFVVVTGFSYLLFLAINNSVFQKQTKCTFM